MSQEIQYLSDIYEYYAAGGDLEEAARDVYVITHTAYLNSSKRVIDSLAEMFEERFGKKLVEKAFLVLKKNEPVICSGLIAKVKEQNRALSNRGQLFKTLTLLEFDLWLIERYARGNNFSLQNFWMQLKGQYGDPVEMSWRQYKAYDIRYIRNYQELAKELFPYHKQIKESRDKLLAVHDKILHPQKEEKKDEIKVEKGEMKEEVKAEKAEMKEEIKVEIQVETKEDIKDEKPQNIESGAKITSIILQEKEERIESLESDLRECKSEILRLKNVAEEQYERGIKDLFYAMNSDSYDKMLDGLYDLREAPDEEAIIYCYCYLENLFDALEDFGLEPIVREKPKNMTKEMLLKEMTCTFPMKDYDEAKTALKYHGWKYKGKILERPTIMLKEEA